MNIPLFQKASMPDSQGVCSEGISRGEAPSTTCAMAAICSGVVPQQPPSIFTSLFSMKGLTALAIVAGSWSYLPKASGIPALGWALVEQGAMAARDSSIGSIFSAPKEQFIPMEKGLKGITEARKASIV